MIGRCFKLQSRPSLSSGSVNRVTAPPCVKPVQTSVVFEGPIACFVFLQEVQSKSKVCANVFCGAGRECAVNEKGEPSCLCIEVSVGSAEPK